jgi:hypothetical protein
MVSLLSQPVENEAPFLKCIWCKLNTIYLSISIYNLNVPKTIANFKSSSKRPEKSGQLEEFPHQLKANN